MANQPETPTYDAGVCQLETTDPAQGGLGGVANKPLLNLASRTVWLYQQIEGFLKGTIVPTGLAMLNSPAFTLSDGAECRCR
jgi:hypothetical protein